MPFRDLADSSTANAAARRLRGLSGSTPTIAPYSAPSSTTPADPDADPNTPACAECGDYDARARGLCAKCFFTWHRQWRGDTQ